MVQTLCAIVSMGPTCQHWGPQVSLTSSSPLLLHTSATRANRPRPYHTPACLLSPPFLPTPQFASPAPPSPESATHGCCTTTRWPQGSHRSSSNSHASYEKGHDHTLIIEGRGRELNRRHRKCTISSSTREDNKYK